MKNTVSKIFSKNNIEYFSLIDYSVCRETAPNIIERSKVTPKSVVLYLLPYYTERGENLSSYAVGIDYHAVIKRINDDLISALKAEYPDEEFVGFGDHSPIDERHAALISGLGILGENGLIINEKYGSYVFVGEIISTLPLRENEKTPITAVRRCGGCQRCKSACPTGILSGEGCDCLSAITQKKGELSGDEIALMLKYNTVWGCDECQRACPYNERVEKSPVSDFSTDCITYLTSERLALMDKAEFSRRAYAWRGRKTIARNLEIYENANETVQNKKKED
jgi:epoxyqueuosine reductase